MGSRQTPLTSSQTLAVFFSRDKARYRCFVCFFFFNFTTTDYIMFLPVFVESSLQQNSTTPATPYSSLPDAVLYPSLSGDVAQATASSNDYQGLLPLDVNCILKPNSFDIAKMDEPTGRKKELVFQRFYCFLSLFFFFLTKLPMSCTEGKISTFPTELTGLFLLLLF